MTVKPLNDRILVELSEAQKQTSSGLYIPDSAQEKAQTGIVKAIGNSEEICVKVGDKALTSKPVQLKDSTLYSHLYEDIYFHPSAGIEESSYVFLEGVELKNTLKGLQTPTLVELGFGTGLNFLLTAQLLENLNYTRPFTYISVEGYPVKRDLLRQLYAQKTFKSLEKPCQRLLALYPGEPSCEQVLKLDYAPNICLTLLLYPVEKALNYIPKGVDYWYLDGFNPKTNPQMWGQEVAIALAKKSHKGAKLATFSACRLVKNTLDTAQFSWKRVKGFKHKKHALKAYKL
ncbi:UNVERIFIED_CONTAM: hypothetical protein PYX00_011053 [Menopon gallinae]|uniref:10 kDa heat shock protein, mitochondrial n=1 Tax=Menopon gallinae TaxID=328185 RepID=A0AAW2H6S2_9NEOP